MKKILAFILLFPVMACYSQDWEKNYDYVDNCICGLSKVQKNGKIGYVNKEGVEIIKPQYQEGLTYHEGYTAVKKDYKWLYLDSTGKAITTAIFEDAGSFSSGLAAVAKNGLYGYINTAGELVIPYEFSNARNFSEDFAPASDSKGYWGYIDKKGNWVIKAVYDFTDDFENGEARVIKDQKVSYINKENKVLHE